jgi:hypothetical protein
MREDKYPTAKTSKAIGAHQRNILQFPDSFPTRTTTMLMMLILFVILNTPQIPKITINENPRQTFIEGDEGPILHRETIKMLPSHWYRGSIIRFRRVICGFGDEL